MLSRMINTAKLPINLIIEIAFMILNYFKQRHPNAIRN